MRKALRPWSGAGQPKSGVMTHSPPCSSAMLSMRSSFDLCCQSALEMKKNQRVWCLSVFSTAIGIPWYPFVPPCEAAHAALCGGQFVHRLCAQLIRANGGDGTGRYSVEQKEDNRQREIP